MKRAAIKSELLILGDGKVGLQDVISRGSLFVVCKDGEIVCGEKYQFNKKRHSIIENSSLNLKKKVLPF
ncbi:hypothetical protein NKR74_23855 [Bacillus sp. 3103sda1]|uniref:hypothetical protein n=1 Tax=Bacillus sp. 3103sda1 TaxID=2953808 RepID=UPI00209D3659|nr:hypothetical protein [Bacillus sp. 3103sda1]MCP1126293.1 hypothetical protein [Bacillus sp. 3103sda1]